MLFHKRETEAQEKVILPRSLSSEVAELGFCPSNPGAASRGCKVVQKPPELSPGTVQGAEEEPGETLPSP